MTTVAAARPALRRPRTMLLAGVAPALARHLGVPVHRIRIGMVLLALAGGAGILLYAWLWAFTPLEDDDEVPRVRRGIPGAAILAALTAAAAIIAVAVALSHRTASGIVPGVVESALAGAAAVGWSLVLDRHDARYGRGYRRTVRIVAGIALVAEGVLLLPFQPDPTTAVLGLIVALVGVAILAIPRVVGLWTDLIEERTARDRESQRAEIAAHLHDSVLQTLALIQQRAEPQSDIARIARAQERELRDWLFAGTDPFAGDLGSELRTIATELELAHPSRFEIVAVGAVDDVREPALAAAAREAMLNAAQHAGGDVSVYVEASADAVDVYVRDRGAGFDADAVPADRIGVRESIIGRLDRAGGRAEVRSGRDGTEVHLHLPRAAGA